MKKIITISIVISFVFLLISIFAFLNFNVSLTYEIEEPKMMFKERALEIEEKGKFLRELIFWIKCIISYLTLTISLLILLLTKMKKLEKKTR